MNVSSFINESINGNDNGNDHFTLNLKFRDRQWRLSFIFGIKT